jgi:hypothetical protein
VSDLLQDRLAARRRAATAPPRAVGAAICAALAVGLVIVEPWRGPILVFLSSGHGLHLGNLPAAVLLVVAGALAVELPAVRSVAERARRGRPAMAVVGAGAVLVVVGLSALRDGGGPPVVEASIALAVLTATAWLLVAAGRSALVPATAFVGGLLLDSLSTPSGTVFGPAMIAACLAIGAPRRLQQATLAATSLGLAALSMASLHDVAGFDVRMAGSDGAPARTASLGLVLVLAGVGEWWLGSSGSRSATRARP